MGEGLGLDEGLGGWGAVGEDEGPGRREVAVAVEGLI